MYRSESGCGDIYGGGGGGGVTTRDVKNAVLYPCLKSIFSALAPALAIPAPSIESIVGGLRFSLYLIPPLLLLLTRLQIL